MHYWLRSYCDELPARVSRSHPDRSGGTCCSSSAGTNLNESTTLPFVIPTRISCHAATKFHRKSGGAKPRDLQCALLPPEYSGTKPQPPNRSVIPTEVEGPAVHHPQERISLEAPPSPLSSRPERSLVEGSAVRLSALPNFPYQTFHFTLRSVTKGAATEEMLFITLE
jgi:hypothetical protein